MLLVTVAVKSRMEAIEMAGIAENEAEAEEVISKYLEEVGDELEYAGETLKRDELAFVIEEMDA